MQQLLNFVEDLKIRNRSSASALLLIHNGQIILEHYSGYHDFRKNSRPIDQRSLFNVASVRKSYLGLAVAFALYDEKIKSLDERVAPYFPNVDEQLLGDTTLRHLLTHSHGLEEDEHGHLFREFPPGTNWAYRDVNVEMMAQLLDRLYGIPFTQLLAQRVFQPLQWHDTRWPQAPSNDLVPIIDRLDEPATVPLGNLQNGRGLYVSTRDLAKWGMLHLNQGVVDDVQVVPKDVISLATSLQSPTYSDESLPQNGLFWFLQHKPASKSEIGEKVPIGSFQIIGVNGPTLLVIPEQRLVAVKMYNKRYNYGQSNYLHYLRKFSNLVSESVGKG
ncbi:penicillin-binding protein [Fictibacillus macauensis ZFHKF-1]|uniref:Penicillin-binding protein n=1 Tax=Fictibacillus macauensis ZFHKF-1 TaxID=1196324 RepID=I8IWP3_9BACL|nr:serine hydrolase domain-containing protein [Fictibacillus macauensis]EIT83916.1 penicillin-binding protein [Fictibacillus macauensis ZFHKF-1]